MKHYDRLLILSTLAGALAVGLSPTCLHLDHRGQGVISSAWAEDDNDDDDEHEEFQGDDDEDDKEHDNDDSRGHDGYDQEGYDGNGYDREGYDHEGYSHKGHHHGDRNYDANHDQSRQSSGGGSNQTYRAKPIIKQY